MTLYVSPGFDFKKLLIFATEIIYRFLVIVVINNYYLPTQH
jgi:hypothetical protein